MARRFWLVALPLITSVSAAADWRVLRDPHVTLYTQAGDESSRELFSRFAQLRLFFLGQKIVPTRALPPLRALLFASEKEYAPYRFAAWSDAYYAASGSRYYIVLPDSGPNVATMAAHEYAHFVLGASGLRLPLWLSEGVAEVFATVRIGERGGSVVADSFKHHARLRRRPWLPLTVLTGIQPDAPELAPRDAREIFYAESWALASMLILSDTYGPAFPRFREALNAGQSSEAALLSVYSTTLDDVARDLDAWVRRPSRPIVHLAAAPVETTSVETTLVSEREMQLLLADVFASGGELDRSEAMYLSAVHEVPQSADAWAALGTISLRRGKNDEARDRWRRAIALGINDPDICYRFAALASWAGESADAIRPALERAIQLRPDFDDAHFLLAMIERNSGRYAGAVTQLRAMRSITPQRAYAYWSALADAYTELGQREEAVTAARQAAESATTPDERAHASTLGYIARTDMVVQIAIDPGGATRMITTRIPHGTEGWNPFVEPGDDLRHVRGKLREIECGDVTRFRVSTPQGLLTLAMPDPSRVEMRNAPLEFTCGEQPGNDVAVDYAAKRDYNSAGLIRGMDFAPAR